MRVLQLVTTPRPFFDTQVRALEARGVSCTTLRVPGVHDTDQSRSAADYLRYYPQVLGHSLGEYDLIHAHYGLLGPFALAQPSLPVVLTLWGSDLMDGESFVQRVSRVSARHSDAVILPSRTMSGYLGADHEVVPWGVDTSLFRPVDRERARERLGWDTEETVVLFPYPPGREVKDYPLAAAVVDRLDRAVTLRTMSGVDYETVPLYMNASDAMLVTSRRESGPMVVKEAAACDVPVVSTDVGFVDRVLDGVAESHVREDAAGLAEALSAVLAGPGRSDGREQVSGLDGMGRAVESIYRRVLA